MRILLLSVLLMLTAVASAQSPISSGQTQCLPLREGNRYVGIRLQQQGRVLMDIRFNAHDALYAMKAQTQGEQLVFSDFRTDGTWQVGSDARVSVAFTPGNAFPLVSFRVPIRQFSQAAWEVKHGKEPLHIFACSLSGAPIFHQRGWVIPTPVVDDHVMHGAFGTAGATVVSAWSPDWTYAPAIGAYPVPVVGLWKPDEGRYVGYEFFDARLSDHSERNVGSAYCWKSGVAKEFFCLTLPYARPYNQLRYPQNGDVFASRFRVLFHTSMRHEDDPNQFVNEVIWSHLPRPLLAKEGSEGRYRDRLTSAPPLNDLLWLPAPYRLERFPTPGLGRLLYRTKGDPFSLDGNLESYGVGWDSPIDYVYATKKEATIAGLREDLNQLAKLAVRFEVNGEPCIYWRKPIEGDWKPHFGKGVPTLHNVNGWLIGTAFLDAYRNERNAEWLPIIDGVLRWTKYILYTRNCYPDVPAAMFAWDAAPVSAFCLKYHFTFRNDPQRRELAQLALKLARSMTYRCLPIFVSDNAPDDNIDASFFMEPNSGIPWLGAACANEIWETAVGVLLTYLHTGDPILGHYLRGMVERFPLLFRDEIYPSVKQYGSAFAERYGLYDGAEQPPGTYSSYGGVWGGLEKLIYPVAGAQVRVVCGERAAMAFNVAGTHTQLREYRSAGKGNFVFRLEGKPPNADVQGRFDVVVTYPLFDLRDKPVRVNGEPREIARFAERFDTLLIRGVTTGAIVSVGDVPDNTLALSVQIAKPRPPMEAWTEPGFKTVPLASQANVTLNLNWDDNKSMAGFFGGVRRIYGVPFALIEPTVNGGKAAVSHAVAVNQTGTTLFALVGAGVPASPQLSLEYADGTRETATLESAAPAIQGWPPVLQWRLWMIAQPLKGRLRQVTPQNCNLFALTLSDKPREQLKATLAAVQQRRVAFLAQQALLQKWQQLSKRLTQLGTLAVIPTPQVSPSAHPLMRALRFNVGAKQFASPLLKTLAPEELVNPKTFTPTQFPIALYLGGETYHQNVREPGDGDRAVQNYLRQGGTLLVSATLPFPFYYNEGGKPVVTAPKFGLPISGSGAERRADRLAGQNVSGWEKPPADVKLSFERNLKQQVITNLLDRFPFPSDGDLRWRPMVNIWTEQEAKYTPVLTLKDDRGKLYGDGIAMVEFLQGEFKGARIVYVWHRLIANPEWANNVLSDVLTYLANQTPPPLAQIAVPRTNAPPQIDGALDDVAWKNAATVKLDWRFHPRNMPAFVALTPTVRTSAKLLWDDRFLYVGFECEDADAWATYTKRDAYLWEEEVVEVYLDPAGKGKHYKEFEVNPIGALIDLDILEAVNGNPGDVPSHLRWNSRDIRWAAKAQGTTDNRNDKDTGWTAEFAIPLEECLFAGDKVFIGDSWRAQFYRIERAKGSTNETAEFQAWSPTDTFHRPERFGILHFAGDPKRGDFARYRNGSDGSPTWKISAGQWQMRDGVYVGKDCVEDGWQPRGASVGVGRLASAATWKNYTVRVRYRVTQRGSDWRDGFWLGFRCGDAGCYALEFTNREAQLHKVPASGGYSGDEHRLSVTPFTPDANWHNLVVHVRGNRIEIEQDGRPLLSYNDDKPLAGGGVTLCARKWSGGTGNTVVEIVKFEVE